MLAERLLAPLVDASVDTLLLGCTHYPFLARTISDVMGRQVVLVDSADETAFRVRALLGELDLGRPPGDDGDPGGRGARGARGQAGRWRAGPATASSRQATSRCSAPSGANSSAPSSTDVTGVAWA